METICDKCLNAIPNNDYPLHYLDCGRGYQCNNCKRMFQKNNHANFKRHFRYCNSLAPENNIKYWEPKKRDLTSKIGGGRVTDYQTAFKNRLQSWYMKNDNNLSDLNNFLNDIRPDIQKLIKVALNEFTAVKCNLMVECTFENMHGEEQDKAFKTRNKSIYQTTDLINVIDTFFNKLKTEAEEAELEKSGWTLKKVDGMRLRINKNNPLYGSTFIPLPKKIEARKACINVKNKDDKCFKYSILAKFIGEHPERVSKYKKLDHRYNFSCLKFPTPLDQIKEFEKINNISINVFGLEKNNKLYPLRIAKQVLPDHRDLLLINNDKNLKNHYVYIKDFEKLIRKQITRHKEHIAVCKRCFSKFDNQYGKPKEKKLEEHMKYCIENKPARVEMPLKHPYLKFECVERFLRVPCVIYADFESILEPISQCSPDPSTSFSKHIQNHKPMSYCLYVKFSDDLQTPREPVLYRGEDAASHFLQQLKTIAEEVSQIYSVNVPMHPMTDEEMINYHQADNCYICENYVADNEKIRDHCHITGRFRGVAHNTCNLRCRLPSFIPVFFHNLSGYDSHLFIKELGYDNQRIEVIPCNNEKYISFTKQINDSIKLRFVDTFRFMPESLDKLSRNLPELKETSQFYSKEGLQLMRRKGVFPYEYVSSWEKLNETELPPRDAFYSKLSDSHISDDDFQHAQSVWKYFECKNLGEYSDYYLKTDVLLLADVFENFRNEVLHNYKLDPAHYFTTPGLTWDAMLKYTGITLELLTEYEMVLMIEKGIRGGICQASHRYAKANNHLMRDFKPEEDSTFIAYQDCNNLYGAAMSMNLPYGEFNWTHEDIDVTKLNENSEYGYILEVDIEYPQHLHKLHCDLPFLPENIVPPEGKYKKLIPHLGSRLNYVIHYIALKQALAHGLVVTKIHRILKFKQSQWLKKYIDFNTELRKNAKNNFEKDLFKLMNNAVFGKTMENIRNRILIHLVSNPTKVEKLISRPDFLDSIIYSEQLASIHMAKKSILYNKPIYIGLCVLDLSKVVMYEYHYDVMLPKYGPECIKLMYMDTDSFIYFVKTRDLHKDYMEMIEYLDTSDFPPDHICYSIKNKKVLGKFKDEMTSKIIAEFIALRAKMYSIKTADENEIKKIKGISRAVVKNKISFDDYFHCLKSSSEKRVIMTTIQSKNHNITTMEINKVGLSPFDDKRKILSDGITTLSHGFLE